jgi:thiosulfate/3-mercaptopyruvate sulfurtransferase
LIMRLHHPGGQRACYILLLRLRKALPGRCVTAFSLLISTSIAFADMLPGALVDVDWLEKNADKITLLDVRADVNSFSKRSKGGSPVNPCGAGVKGKEAEPVAGHIPGAVLVRWSLLTTQQKVAGQKTDGWLPTRDDFERLMQKTGVNKGQPVVIAYKGEKAIEAAMAARLYFTLKYFGHDQVAILDGGTAAWLQSGRKVKFGRSRSGRGDFEAGPGRTELIAVMADIKKISEGGKDQLLDTREQAGYLGVARNIASVDRQWHGHIPGAKNVPLSLLSNDLGPAAYLFDKDTLQQNLSLMGADPNTSTTVYCNTGLMASVAWFVLSELMGNSSVRLYDGSMQEWSLSKMPIAAMKQ